MLLKIFSFSDAVVATMFEVPWTVVYARKRHGALLPTRGKCRASSMLTPMAIGGTVALSEVRT